MKIGKQPKRFGKPSEKFYARKAAQEEAKAKIMPKTGNVALYVDDERECPKGWVLVRSAEDFMNLFKDQSIEDRITHLSLDWYLGACVKNGEAIADWLADKFQKNPNFMPKLEAIGLHSSDREKAIKMFHTIVESIDEERRWDIMIDTETPSL